LPGGEKPSRTRRDIEKQFYHMKNILATGGFVKNALSGSPRPSSAPKALPHAGRPPRSRPLANFRRDSCLAPLPQPLIDSVQGKSDREAPV